MTDNDATLTTSEPEDWVVGQQLFDTELLVTTLCRFSGMPVNHSEQCPVRTNMQHPDLECRSMFFQAAALRAGVIDLEGFDEMPEEIRQPWQGGTPIGSAHR